MYTYSKVKKDIYNKNMDYSYSIIGLCVKFDDRQILKDLSFLLAKDYVLLKEKAGVGKAL